MKKKEPKNIYSYKAQIGCYYTNIIIYIIYITLTTEHTRIYDGVLIYKNEIIDCL